jgi:FlaA1/EpsC-like NDP-sugar epimerase
MIAVAGRAGEIDVVYTGLRPGEKVSEELLTEDEERSQVVRDRIFVTSSPPPPPDLERWLSELRVLAQAGDRGGILSVLRALVPTYAVPRNVVDADRSPLAPPERAAAPEHATRLPPPAELALE